MVDTTLTSMFTSAVDMTTTRVMLIGIPQGLTEMGNAVFRLVVYTPAEDCDGYGFAHEMDYFHLWIACFDKG